MNVIPVESVTYGQLLKREDADRVLCCSYPFLIESIGEYASVYPYSHGATCFFVRYEKRMFAVTAGHGVKDILPERILVAPRGTQKTVPFRSMHEPNKHDPSDPDFLDIAVLPVDMDLYATLPTTIDAFEMTDDSVLIHRQDDPAIYEQLAYITRGWPKESAFSDIEYGDAVGEGWIYRSDLVAIGIPDPDLRTYGDHNGAFSLYHSAPNLSEIESFNGMSGSPVFSVLAVGNDRIFHFAGMVTSVATKVQTLHFEEGPVFYFIPGYVVYDFIKHVNDGLMESEGMIKR